MALAVTLVAFGVSSNAALSIISQGVHPPAISIDRALSTRAARFTMGPPRAAENRWLLSSARQFASPGPVALEAPKAASAVAMRALVLRSKPMPTAAALESIAKGDSLIVKSKQGRWWLVRTSDDKEGWLVSSYLIQQKS